jgi:outer membrane exchange protein TraA
MQRRLFLSLLCSLAGLPAVAGSANAVPIYLGKFEAVAEPRKDPGTGLCGSVSKFKNQPAPLVTIEDALGLLDRLPDDPNLVGRVSRLFQTMNFSVGTGSEGDFRAPMYSDDFFPYCQDPMAMPMGNDDSNIAMRIRGYLNVPDTLGGNPLTFAAKCDDGCALFLGRSKQMVIQANDDSPQLTGRRARWVVFTDPGLYPVEIVYFQNSTTGYLEWSRANLSVFSSDDLAVDVISWGMQATKFTPLGGAELYSSIVGSNPACIECGAPGMDCSAGSYCGDGLCQPCAVSEHCGPSCLKCPEGRPLCSDGKCKECTGDSMCATGSTCDVESGTCKTPPPPTGCTSNAQCRPPDICRPEGFCGEPPKCNTDVDCAGNIGCACVDGTSTCMQKVCIVPPSTCVDDSECPLGQRCEAASQLCKTGDRYLYEGGLAGCGMSRANPGSRPAFALFGLSLVALGALFRRRRSRHGA